MSTQRSDVVWRRELEEGTEIPPHEKENESLMSTIAGGFAAIRSTIVSAICESLKVVLGACDGLLPLVTYLVNGLLSLIGSISALATGELPTWTRALLYGTALTSVTTLVVGMSDLATRLGFSWFVDAATAEAQSTLSDIVLDPSDDVKTTANSVDPMKWVKLGVFSLVAVLFAGLGVTKVVSWKDLVLTGNVTDAVRKCGANVSGVADFLVNEVLGYEADADYPICKELEALADDGAELQRLSPAHFVQHADDLHRLDQYLKRIIKASTSKINKQTSYRYQTVRHLLVVIYKNLEEKRRTIDGILVTKPRIVTIGLYISGAPSVGKSKFGVHLSNKICDRLGVRQGVYTLNRREDGFYELYGGQPCGGLNEFMARRSEDPFLKDLNLVISGDPMNFESASLDGKIQPCRLRFVFLTSNTDTPDFSRVLNEGAAQAVWDRLYHIKLEDPLCRGRQAPNPHRKPDFSHLNVTSIEHDGRAIYERPTTINNVIGLLTSRCADEEVKFLNNCLPECDENTKTALTSRITVLESLIREHPPYEPRFVDNDVLLFPDEHSSVDTSDIVRRPARVDNRKVFTRANAWGREFFSIRLQGPPGSGKTTAAERMAKELQNLFGYKIILIKSLKEFVPTPGASIYVFDDCVEAFNEGEHQTYLELMNATHPRSIFIVCSNTVYFRKRILSFSSLVDSAVNYALGNNNVKPWDTTAFKGPTGVLRRIGLQGFIRLPSGEIIQTSETLNRTYTFDTHFIVRDAYDTIGNIDGMVDIAFDMYRVFLEQPADFMLVENEPPFVDKEKEGVKIAANTIPSLVKCLKSKYESMRAFTGKHDRVNIFVSPSIAGMSSPSQTMVNQWGIPEEEVDDVANVKSIFSRMCGTFQRAFPGKSLTVTIKDRGLNFYFINNIGYMYSNKKIEEDYPISISDGRIVYRLNSVKSCVITVEQLVCMHKFSQYHGDLASLTRSQVRTLNRWVDNQLNAEACELAFRIAYDREMAKHSRVYDKRLMLIEAALRKHPIFWTGCALLALIGAGSLAYMLFNRFIRKSEDKPASNSATPAEDKGRAGPQLVISRITPNDDSTEFKTSKGRYHASRVTGVVAAGRMHPKFKANHSPAVERLYERLESVIGDPSEDEKQAILRELVDYTEGRQLPDEETLVSILLADVDNGERPFVALCNAMQISGRPNYSATATAVHSNMLKAQNMIPNRDTVCEELHRSLNRVYYRLIDSELRSCYAVGLRGRFLLTVSHMFKEAGDRVAVHSGDNKYTARCVYLVRPRDLAVIYVEDKSFPDVSDTARFFHTMEDINDALYGYMLRCGPNFEIMGGGMGYHPTTMYPIDDAENPNFKLTDKVVVFVAAGVNNVKQFVKPGDCGFPCITPTRNGDFRIAGIHCAYNSVEKVYFSCFSKEDHASFLTKASAVLSNSDGQTNIGEVEMYKGLNFITPKAYINAIQNLIPDMIYTEHHDKLEILGYSKEFHLDSQPKSSHRRTACPGLETPCLTMPAAFRMDYVTDDSAIARNSRGRPDPLLTQILKYDRTKKTNIQMEDFVEALQLVSQDMQIRYGGCKFLRLYHAVNGIPGRALAPIDPATSAGPLLKKLYKIHNKAPLFKLGDSDAQGRTLVFNETDAAVMVRQHYDTFYKSLLTLGPPPLLISKDCAKVELIEAEKAVKGKVRLFNEVDLSVNLILRSFFGDFISKIMEQHEDSPIKMGQDPYKSATHILRSFNEIDGDVNSTDFSAYDKQLCAPLIRGFCYCVALCYVQHNKRPRREILRIFSNLADTLIYALHIFKGTFILVDRGNESGTAVTTALNSVSQDIVNTYSLVRRWKKIFFFIPSLSELEREVRKVYLGDDGTTKTSRALRLTEQELIEDSAHFCLVRTRAKADGDVVFCGRSLIWDERNQIAWPALRLHSVFSQLHWYSNFSRDQIIQNLDNCLFEAALHTDPSIFSMMYRDALRIIKFYSMEASVISFHSRDLVRMRYIAYVRGGRELDVLSTHTDDVYKIETPAEIVQRTYRVITERIDRVHYPDTSEAFDRRVYKFRQILLKPQDLMSDPAVNPVSALLERLQAAKLEDRPKDEYIPTESGYLCTATLFGSNVSGVGRTKQLAKRDAYASLYHLLANDLDKKVEANHSIFDQAKIGREKLGKTFMFESVRVQLAHAIRIGRALQKDVRVLCRKVPDTTEDSVDGIRFGVDRSGTPYVLSATAQKMSYERMSYVYLTQPRTYKTVDDDSISVEYMEKSTSNVGTTQTGTLPGADAMGGPGISTNPRAPNLVPASYAPAFPTNPPANQSANELLEEDCFNMSGVNNGLKAGAIEFRIDDLVYNQMIDSNQLIKITDDSPEGTILVQIPYSLNSPFINAYIKAYASLHERYAGDLVFRFNLLGNQTFSGELIVFWYPNKIKGNTVLISDAHKYSYVACPINEMWNKTFRLKDARRDQFYRLVGDDTDVDSRPHLVVAILMAAQSPLREGITVRLRISSKLSENFELANPILPGSSQVPDGSALGLFQNQPERLIGSPLFPTLVRPNLQIVTPLKLVMDGQTWIDESQAQLSFDYNFTTWPYKSDNLGRAISLDTADRADAYTQFGFLNNSSGTHGLYIHLGRAPLFLTEAKSAVSQDGDSNIAGGFALPAALSSEVVSKWSGESAITDPINQVKDIFGNARYKDLGGNGRYLYYIKLNTAQEEQVWLANNETDKSKHITPKNRQSYLMMTTYGPVLLSYVFCQDSDLPTGNLLYGRESYVWNLATQVNNISFDQTPEAMPAGWRHVVITPEVPWVYPQGSRTASLLNHPSVIALMDYQNFNISASQCLQISIGDVESGRDICWLRYFPDRKCFVMNCPDSKLYYAVALRQVDRMYITSSTIVERGTDFPATNADANFVDNQVNPGTFSRPDGAVFQ